MEGCLACFKMLARKGISSRLGQADFVGCSEKEGHEPLLGGRGHQEVKRMTLEM